ncbi:putative nucleoside diphosphate hydrolase [Cardiosporidium cionae]|uniref:Nucleoside diphosphate hydrolase n=1 Tax=Cardiosporidium cionae TaxID=476202 RepID=A0ABQ7J9G3_9APIC|nr:putative nucleoside diphosphate hydrolase [Cardiosporidium cionae]|eukprot:KAF8820617.1 putative nucleoside diphosphate hydrolase [Cardiosporidium cionae]
MMSLVNTTAIKAGSFISANELVAIVDENDEFVKAASRKEMRLYNLIHRSTVVIVYDYMKEAIFIHKRSAAKEWCPSHYDTGFGGVVNADEICSENASRELFEEAHLQRSPDELEFLGKTYFGDNTTKVFTSNYVAFFDGEADDLTPQAEEVQYIEKVPLQVVQQRIDSGELFVPQGIKAFSSIRKRLESISSEKKFFLNATPGH